jgi:hypothetical protein
MQVQPHKISELNEKWIADGEPYCTHNRIATVQDMGYPPEELCCMICGLSWDKGTSTPEPRGKK